MVLKRWGVVLTDPHQARHLMSRHLTRYGATRKISKLREQWGGPYRFTVSRSAR